MAITHYSTVKAFKTHSLVKCLLKTTGKRHQIRRHMEAIHHPIIGDYLYNDNYKKESKSVYFGQLPQSHLNEALSKFDHPALHAESMTPKHPRTGETLTVTAEPPEDFEHLIKLLEQDMSESTASQLSPKH